MVLVSSLSNFLAIIAFLASNLTGRPPFRPRARAALSPARVRSLVTSLKFCKSAKDVKDKLATGSSGIYTFLQTL